MNDERFRSSRLPGGDLISALFDRQVMTLADRGGASNLIGDRWADLAADYAATWPGSGRTISSATDGEFPIVRVDRLDDTPRIAAAASRRGLQNPDLLLIGERGQRQAIQAADAKFSVETARAKQVSPDVVLALLGIRDVLPELLPGLGHEFEIEPGIFLCPDYPLTHLMLRRRHGIVRTTVTPDEVVFVPAPPDRFWDGVEGTSIMPVLAEVDQLPARPEESLLAGVYYFRLARAAVGLWLDSTRPLLAFNDTTPVDELAVRDEAARRAAGARSAWSLIRDWDADVQAIRDQRTAVDQVIGLPIPGRDLRPLVERFASAAGGEPPSANQVRRRLGAWYRAELRDRVGPILPPVDDFGATLEALGRAAREVAPRAEPELARIVHDLMQDRAAAVATSGSDRRDG